MLSKTFIFAKKSKFLKTPRSLLMSANLSPLLPANHLSRIPVSDKPPQLGGKLRRITPQEFKEQFACEFTEAIWRKKEDVNDVLKGWRAYDATIKAGKIEASERFTAKVLHRLKQPFTDFVISKISDPVGYGFFATKDIPRNTAIALYSGAIVPCIEHESYSFRVNLDVNKTSLSVSSLKHGGIARFLQHLPKDGEKRRKDLFSRLTNIDYILRKHGETEITRESVACSIVQRKDDLEKLARESAASEYDTELEDYVFSQPEVKAQIAVRNVHVKKRKVSRIPFFLNLGKPGFSPFLTFLKKFWKA